MFFFRADPGIYIYMFVCMYVQCNTVYRFEGADDSGNPRFNLGFPDETFNMFVGCKNLSNTH